MTIKDWWESVKDNPYWSGAIVGLSWDDLESWGQDQVRVIYEAARKDCRSKKVVIKGT